MQPIAKAQKLNEKKKTFDLNAISIILVRTDTVGELIRGKGFVLL